MQDAQNVPLDYINDHLSAINRDTTQYIHCAAGYRSMAFASILKARGFENVVNVTGGFKALKAIDRFTMETGR
ncbi:rhodanese-like domain-containing protein [Niabella hibiscisoli]|uniref:rhodanese-like domain-containing protein n=1 Tax=Niabella hibiscisoli TaxID=1825928 RepID=UPI00293EDF9E|nr:rhodanese-like domain-containing protein [Niabella hibiscisoli]